MTLSPREREVVMLLGDGEDRTYKVVAETLGIEITTLETHVTRVLARYPSKKRWRAALQDLYRSLQT